jgi:hydrogenase nickel incorporation protein HypB
MITDPVTNAQSGLADHGHSHAHGHHHHHHHHHHYYYYYYYHHHDHREHAHHHHDEAALHAGIHGRTVQLEQDLLAKNQLIAQRNRGWFEGREILAVNLMSSPGAGRPRCWKGPSACLVIPRPSMWWKVIRPR